ncbi:MAG: hypothetical protein K6E14_03900 [Paludibacteraceae bacterium]|nr:hypothetical protein [Paludibacteraceae bacterium]
MARKNQFELSYSHSKIPAALCMFISFFVLILSCAFFDKIGFSQDDIKHVAIGICCCCFVGIILTMIIARVKHAVIFDDNGITLKNGKEKLLLLWKSIKTISYTKKGGFKHLIIETKDETSQNKIYFLPIELSLSPLKEFKEKELVSIDEYISKNLPKDLINLDDENKFDLISSINSESYTLQRKPNFPVLIMFLCMFICFFFVFDLILAITFTLTYSLICFLSINHGKDDLVFDASGITFYRKRDISFVEWNKLIRITLESSGGKETLKFSYKDENDNLVRKEWEIIGYFNNNGDIYDYFVNVSTLRGKSAIDSIILSKK